MLKKCEGCFSINNCIIRQAIVQKYTNKNCPCSDCLVKMICDDNSIGVCDNVKELVDEIRETLGNYQI